MSSRRLVLLCAFAGALSTCNDPASHAADPAFSIENPYRNGGSWYKANFHVHSAHSHGRLTAGPLVELYRQNGYSVLCVTDHNMYGDQDGGVHCHFFQNDSLLHDWNGDGSTYRDSIFGSGVEAYVRDWTQAPPAWMQDRWFRPPGTSVSVTPLVISGCEASYPYFGAHFGLVGYPAGAMAPPRPGFAWLAPLHEAGGFAFIAHPGDANKDVDRFAAVLPLDAFDAMEIMNGARLTRGEAADATPLWDALLTRGYRLWGMANDDAHKLPGEDELYPFVAFDMLLGPEPTVPGVLAALHAGSFYSSTGLLFEELRLDGATLRIAAPGATRIRFIGRNGVLLGEVAAASASYRIQGHEGYVRAEALGDLYVGPLNSWVRTAWTQPFQVVPSPAGTPKPAHQNG
jgi:hypothetical protein